MTLTLAPTHSRLIARSIDSFLYVPPIVGLMMIFVSGLTANPEVSAEMLQAVADQTKPVQSLAPLFYTDSSGKILILAGLYCLALFLYQLYLLIWQGQTLGKKWMKIRIVRRDTGLNGGFVPNIFLRIIVNMLL
ncbi:MAG: hypothetical protein JWM56_1305, partial [Candidatus Peribacteria bacterium]|nr:hypothetical protein [Candidatus Peribacteria bacterium]